MATLTPEQRTQRQLDRIHTLVENSLAEAEKFRREPLWLPFVIVTASFAAGMVFAMALFISLRGLL
jgi:hypothetical protein